MMDKKQFIILGLSLIHLDLLIKFTTLYISYGKMNSDIFGMTIVILLPALIFAFGLLLFKRFRAVGYTTWALIPCFFIYMESLNVISSLNWWYSMNVIHESGAQARFFEAIHTHYDSGGTGSPWTITHKLDYLFINFPGVYAQYMGYYVLLFLASSDPRKPSKYKAISFLKSLFKKRKISEFWTAKTA